jgi:RNA polymerase sigma-70 factor, ECF subfamily
MDFAEQQARLLTGSDLEVQEASTGIALDRLKREIAGLYEEYGPALLRYARAVSKSADLARDAVQEAFLRYQAQRANGSIITSPRPWLYKVVFNVIMDGAGEPNVPLDEVSTARDPAFGPHEHAEASALEDRFVQILSPRELAAVRLRSEGLSYDEIAYALGLRIGTVGAMLSRAVVKIKRHMAGCK